MKTLLTLILAFALGLLGAMGIAGSGERTTDPLGIAVSPQTLILNSDQGGRVTVHTDISARLVDRTSLALNGIPATGTGVDACGQIVGFFAEDAIEAMVSPPSAVLTLTGLYLTGEPFEGSDTVRVTEK